MMSKFARSVGLLPCCMLLPATCADVPYIPAERSASTARFLAGTMSLDVTDIAPGKTAGYRVVGGLPSTKITVVRGTPGLSSCPPKLGGSCFSLGNVKEMGNGTADASGNLLFEVTMPGGGVVGSLLGFQAYVTPASGPALLSNVVERTVISANDYAGPPATNVLVLLIDDVGVDRIGLYGAENPATTPVIDGLASQGMVFSNAWALPACSPTRAALQTGRHARRTGYGTGPKVQNSSVELDRKLITLAELVEHSPWERYATSYIGKWHLSGFFSSGGFLGPVSQGWDWWTGAMENLDGYFSWTKVDTNGSTSIESTYATTDNVDEAIGRVNVMAEPWMLQVSFNGAHAPFHVPPPVLHTVPGLTASSPDSDKHRAMTEAVDTEIGRLLAGIPADELARTTVFVIGDNGTPTEVLEAGEANVGRAKGTVFDGGVRVPFIVTGPLVGAPGSTTEVMAHVVDVFPTLADIAGVDTETLRGALDPTNSVALDGFSLLPTLADPAISSGRTRLYSEYFEPGGSGPFADERRAIRDDRYKLIVDVNCATEEFFEYTAGALNEGDNLLDGVLTPEQTLAYDRLQTELDELVAGLVYDASTFPNDNTDTTCQSLLGLASLSDSSDSSDTGTVDTAGETGDTGP